MSTKIYLRRGTQAEIQAIIPEMGEPVWSTDTGDLYVGDGATSGGIWVAGPGVQELNGLEDAVTLLGGSGISVTISGQYIIIDEEAGGLDVDSLNALTGNVVLIGTGNVDITESGQNILISGMLHAATHENGGVDEMNVVGLSGLLADDQHVLDSEVVAVAIAITTLTTRGDIIYRNATVPARLAKGAANTVLVMGANDPAWSATLAGLTLTSPTINGTIATTGLTMPAFTLGGAVAGGAQALTNIQSMSLNDGISQYGDASLPIKLDASAAAGKFIILASRNAANNAQINRLTISTRVDEATAAWVGIVHTGLKLGGSVDLNSQVFDAGGISARINTTGSLQGLEIHSSHASHAAQLKFVHDHSTPGAGNVAARFRFDGYDGAEVAGFVWGIIDLMYTNVGDGTEASEWRFKLASTGGQENTAMTLSGPGMGWFDLGVDVDDYYLVAGTKVIGARVVDARCDDVINCGDAVTDGVIDSLRDAMITHGLIAAA